MTTTTIPNVFLFFCSLVVEYNIPPLSSDALQYRRGDNMYTDI